MITLPILYEAQRKDVRAQRMIFDAYGKVLYRLAKRYLSDQEMAKDAVAESFYIILKKMGSSDFIAIPPFEMWMKRIVVNECLRMLKKSQRFEILPEVDEVNCIVNDDTIENLTAEKIFMIIESLPVGYRTVFNLYEIEGYSHAEISELLGISLGTSKSQLSKAKGLLQRKVIELDPVYAKRKAI